MAEEDRADLQSPASSSLSPPRSPRVTYTVSSGFATMHPNNAITINAVEAYDIADFDASVRRCLCFLLPRPPARLPRQPGLVERSF